MGSSSAVTQGTIRFGEDFEFDPRALELRNDGRALKLERIPVQVLLILVEQKGQLVTREEIAEKIWGKGAFLDTDNSINGAIRKIRQVSKGDPQGPRYVQTLSGRGYRFIAPVFGQELETPAPAHQEASGPQDAAQGTTLEERTAEERPGKTEDVAPPVAIGNWRRFGWLAAVSCSCAIGISAWIGWMTFMARVRLTLFAPSPYFRFRTFPAIRLRNTSQTA